MFTFTGLSKAVPAVEPFTVMDSGVSVGPTNHVLSWSWQQDQVMRMVEEFYIYMCLGWDTIR